MANDKESDPEWWQCERCEDWFHFDYDIMQPNIGHWEERSSPDEKYHIVCEDCRTEVRRAL